MTDMPKSRDGTNNAAAAVDGRAAFDYSEPAELFTRRNPAGHIAAGTSPADAERARARATHRNAIAYRRFESVAEAIRFAIEELPPDALARTVVVVNGERHEPAAIRSLYESADYPLLGSKTTAATPNY
jgi:hypothetical protein